MKKSLIVTFAVLSLAAPVLAGGADISLRPRIEGAYNSLFNREGNDFDLGMSALFGFLDGEITDDLSYSATFFFLNSDPSTLYNYESPCVDGTWLQMAYLSYNRDLWGLDLGKILLNYGGFINEYDDVDVYSGLIPYYGWYEQNSYLYGATLRLTPSENHSFEAQFTTSPSCVSSDDLKFAGSLCWRGQMGNFSTVWGCNVYGEPTDWYYEPEDGDKKVTSFNIGLGNRYEFNEFWNVEFDAFLNLPDGKLNDFENSDFRLTGACSSIENFTIKGQIGLSFGNTISYGALVEYTPVDFMRLHAAVDYCHNDDGLYMCRHIADNGLEASLGLTLMLDYHLGK